MEKILETLNSKQREIIKKAAKPDATILFNIKGMIQILHNKAPFEFIEMGYDDIESLKRKEILIPIRTMEESHILQGEEYTLSDFGKKISSLLK